MRCRWCETRPATIGSCCNECFVAAAGEVVGLLDVLGALCDVARTRGHAVAFAEDRDGRWTANIGPVPPMGQRATATTLQGAAEQLAQAIAAEPV